MSEHTGREQQNRERAYSLWQEAGSPEDRQDEFWHQARELDAHELDSAGQANSAEGAGEKVPRQ